MDIEKKIDRLTKLVNTLHDVNNSSDFDEFLEENDIDLQELMWGCEYYLEQYLCEVNKCR